MGTKFRDTTGHLPLPTGCRDGGSEEGERNVSVEVSSEPRCRWDGERRMGGGGGKRERKEGREETRVREDRGERRQGIEETGERRDGRGEMGEERGRGEKDGMWVGLITHATMSLQ